MSSRAKRCWAELLARTFEIDVPQCRQQQGGMKLLAIVIVAKSFAR
jgi:hypothetical protein